MSKRNDRVASLIHREVAEMLQWRIKDPRLEGLTVTRVEMSPDVHYAWIYIDLVSHPERVEKALEALHRASGFMRGELRQKLKLRFTPELVFRADQGLAYSEKINHILSDLKAQGEFSSESPEVTELP